METISQKIKKLELKGYSIKKIIDNSSKMKFYYIINDEKFAEMEYDNNGEKWDLILHSIEAFKQLKDDDCLVCYDVWHWYNEGFQWAEKELNKLSALRN